MENQHVLIIVDDTLCLNEGTNDVNVGFNSNRSLIPSATKVNDHDRLCIFDSKKENLE